MMLNNMLFNTFLKIKPGNRKEEEEKKERIKLTDLDDDICGSHPSSFLPRPTVFYCSVLYFSCW